MEKVIINIDRVPDNFTAAPANEDIACVATGHSLEEVERKIQDALALHISGMREYGETVPSEFSGEWEPVFHLTTRAQLKCTEEEMLDMREATLEEGREEGREEQRRSIARIMLDKGYPMQDIAEITGLSKEEIEAL